MGRLGKHRHPGEFIHIAEFTAKKIFRTVGFFNIIPSCISTTYKRYYIQYAVTVGGTVGDDPHLWPDFRK